MVSPRPNTPLVAQAWIATIPGFDAAMVAGALPADNSSWSASGFVVASSTVGGLVDIDTGARQPVVQISCWSCSPGGGRPPLGLAYALAEAIVDACRDDALTACRALTLPGACGQARVLTAYPVGPPPRRIPADPASYAHIVFDVAFHWIPL